MASNIVGLNPSQVVILKALAASKGLTTQELEARVGPDIPCSPQNLGPAYKETLESNPSLQGSLWGLGLVRPMYDEIDGKMVCLWHATGKGRLLADSLRVKPRQAKGAKIPNHVLDPVVREFRKTRTYGIEVWTDDDIQEVQALLGEEGEGYTLDSIRQQIANRRKQGAFADPTKKLKTSVEKAIREFGPEGTLAQVLTPEQVAEMKALYRMPEEEEDPVNESEDGE